MEERILRKTDSGVFYLVAFFVGLIGMFLLAIIVQWIGLFLADPVLVNEYMEAIRNNTEIPQRAEEVILEIGNYAQFISTGILSVGLLVIMRKPLWDDFKEFRKNIWYNLLCIFLGFIIVYIVSSGMVKLYDLLKISGNSENQEAIEESLASSSGYLMLISVIFFAPFMEELIFRKFIFGFSEKLIHLPMILTVLLSALIFAAMHGVDVFYFQYLALALILCFSYAIFKKNIYIPMGIHFLNNLMVLLVFLEL